MHDVPGETHWHEPTAGQRAGFGKFGRPKTPYDVFMESEGIPIVREIGISKVQNLPLAPWKRTGGRGTYIQLYGTEGKWGSYPPLEGEGRHLAPARRRGGVNFADRKLTPPRSLRSRPSPSRGG